MKRIRRIFMFLVVAVMCFNAAFISALAVEQDGLEVVLTTDRSSYQTKDQIAAVLKVKNTGSTPVNNVELKTLLPAGYVISNQTSGSKTISQLGVGAEETLEVSFLPSATQPVEPTELTTVPTQTTEPTETTDATEQTTVPATQPVETTETTEETTVPAVQTETTKPKPDAVNPDTSDFSLSGGLLFVFLLSGGVTVYLMIHNRKMGQRFLSLLLCLVMAFSLMAPLQAQAAQFSRENVSVSAEITVDGKTISIEGVVSYDKLTAYTVSFQENGAEEIEDQYIKQGQNAAMPSIPTKEGFAFMGWFEDEELQKLYNFDAPVDGDLVLHAGWMSTDKTDTDGDGLTDAEEAYYKTDKTLSDTDADGLSDYVEVVILGTDPLKQDTDGNGVNDADEDRDGDQVTNGQELKDGTNLVAVDTDGEGLSDGQEKELGTNPLKQDTDDDGETDYQEYLAGTDPKVPQDPAEVIVRDYTLEAMGIQGTQVTPSLRIEADRKTLRTLRVEPREDGMINFAIPGYIGEAFDFKMDGTFQSAALSMKFDPALLQQENFVPAIYYFNEETQMLEELPTTVEGNVATAQLEHFSTYILLNKTAFDAVWTNEIKPPQEQSENSKLDIAFVIDYSASMDDNDPNQIFKSLTKEFVGKLRPEIDRAAVVKFIAKAYVVHGLSADKDAVNQAVDSIVYDSGYNYDSGTNGSDGISKALDLLDGSKSDYKYIIFITDGMDNRSSYSYSALEKRAKDSGVNIYTIGMGSASATILQQLAAATGGKYYHATTSSGADDVLNLDDVYDKIQSETIDFSTDSNHDGISDYYTKLLVSGILKTGTGVRPFAAVSYKSIQANNDYDGDGLTNGEEVLISQQNNKIYMYMKSSPVRKDSDGDGYSDYQEVKKMHTSPLNANIIISSDHKNYLKNSENFVSNKYKEFYDSAVLGSLEQGSIWIGTHIFGTDYDHSMIYKAQFVEYFDRMKQKLTESNKWAEMGKFAWGLTNQVLSIGGQIADSYTDYLNVPENVSTELETLIQRANHLDDMRIHANGSAFSSHQEYYKYVDDLAAHAERVRGEHASLLKNSKMSVKLKKFNKIAGGVGYVMAGIDIVANVGSILSDYAAFCSQMETMRQHMDIFDVIIGSNADDDVIAAARDIQYVLMQDYEDGIAQSDFIFSKLGNQTGYGKQVVLSTCGKLFHVAAGFVPYVKYVELAVGVLDFCFNLSGVAKECLKVNGITSTADALRDGYLYETADKTELRYFICLMFAREEAEYQMIDAVNANTFLMEWLFRDIMYPNKQSQENIDRINGFSGGYLAKLAG